MGFPGSQSHRAPGWCDDPLWAASSCNSPFAGLEAQLIPFLRGITTLAGSGPTALAAIVTAGITVSYAVYIMSSDGAMQLWVLQESTLLTQNGVQRANDYSDSNPKAWIIS